MMKRSLVAISLFVCFLSVSAFADDATTKIVVHGNQGYIYGTLPKAVESSSVTTTTDTASAHPIGDILNGIWKLDEWVRINLW